MMDADYLELLDRGASVHRTSWTTSSLFPPEPGEVLASRYGADLGNGEAMTHDACEAMHRAAESGLMHTLRTLLDRVPLIRQHIHVPVARCQTSLLYASAKNGHVRICKMLIEEYGHDVAAGSIWGDSCLAIAVLRGHADVVRLLLCHGASPDNCAEVAAVHGHLECFQALIFADLPSREVLQRCLDAALGYRLEAMAAFVRRAMEVDKLELACECLHVDAIARMVDSCEQLDLCAAQRNLSKSPLKQKRLADYQSAKQILASASNVGRCRCASCALDKR